MLAKVLAGVLILTLAGCGEPSPVDPDARVVVRGQVEHGDGSPVADGRVLVIKKIGFDEFAAGFGLLLGTAGIACIVGADIDLCDESGTAGELGEDGAFAIELRGEDVQSGFGTKSTMQATVAGANQGTAVTSADFQVEETSVSLPVLRLWEPQLDVSDSGGVLTVDWPALPDGYGQAAGEQALVLTADATPVWSLRRQGDPAAPAQVDARVLEDAGVAVVAQARVDAEGNRGETVYRSPQSPVQGPGAPPSRGATCRAVATQRNPVAYDPCPVTDGQLANGFDPALDPKCPGRRRCPHHDTRVVIDLGAVRDISLLVVRAAEDQLVLEGSADAGRWTRLGMVRTGRGRGLLRPEPGSRARYVRLGARRWPLPELYEVSVW